MIDIYVYIYTHNHITWYIVNVPWYIHSVPWYNYNAFRFYGAESSIVLHNSYIFILSSVLFESHDFSI